MRKLVLDTEHLRAEARRAGATESRLAEYIGATLGDVSRAFNRQPMTPEFIFRLSVGLDQIGHAKAKGGTPRRSLTGGRDAARQPARQR